MWRNGFWVTWWNGWSIGNLAKGRRAMESKKTAFFFGGRQGLQTGGWRNRVGEGAGDVPGTICKEAG